MTLVALMLIGLVGTYFIPVSLMPDVSIPVITVQVTQENMSPRELDNTITGPLRRSLGQVTHLEDLSSETRNETSTIRLSFAYGTNIDLAFIEVNEKIDRAMSMFPRNIVRPRVIKANASDIPVFYLNVTLPDRRPTAPADSTSISDSPGVGEANVLAEFMKLSSFADQVIRRRLEQLPEVALVDMTGLVYPEIIVRPLADKMQALQLTSEHLEQVIRDNQIDLGELLIHEGQYQYNVRFNSTLTSRESIENIYFQAGDRILQLKDVARVIEAPQARRGLVLSDGNEALTMAIIKQGDARMNDLEGKLHDLIHQFETDYPHIRFTITRDQTELLDYSISNLQQDLVWGSILALLLMTLFLRDIKSPLLIAITMPASLILTLAVFWLLGISVNIISLSGLVLGIGMMIDNSIIVIDNIAQYSARGYSLLQACIRGSEEVFLPMLSSVFTTCAVFIPLIFMSGISGALFYDEAIAVIAGAFVSLALSMTIIPVYYKIIQQRTSPSTMPPAWLHNLRGLKYEKLYQNSFHYLLRHQCYAFIAAILILVAGAWAYVGLPKSKLPPLTETEEIVSIDWNQHITVAENRRRVLSIIQSLPVPLTQYTGLLGEQQFLLAAGAAKQSSEAVLYIRTENADDLLKAESQIIRNVGQYPGAIVHLSPAENIFNMLFPDNTAPLVANLRIKQNLGPGYAESLSIEVNNLQSHAAATVAEIPWQEYRVLRIDPLKLKMYDIDLEILYEKLKVAFNEKRVFQITENQQFIPVTLGGDLHTIHDILEQTQVTNMHGKAYYIRDFVLETKEIDLKTIAAGQSGEYFSFIVDATAENADSVMHALRRSLKQKQLFQLDFTGSIFTSQALIRELTAILTVSLLILYFILAAQFESLLLPLIVLLEIPIDIAGVFISLKLFNSGINLMSMIGIVVMGGIIINDSILKIDTINELRKSGVSLLRAIVLGGHRRLKSILMTSLTTVLAMVPLLFTPGMGAELQRPLAVALGGGMLLGTAVSLYLIPLCYYQLQKRGKS